MTQKHEIGFIVYHFNLAGSKAISKSIYRKILSKEKFIQKQPLVIFEISVSMSSKFIVKHPCNCNAIQRAMIPIKYASNLSNC